MARRSLGFLPSFTPRRYQRRMSGAGTSVEHSLGANRRSYSTLHFGYLPHTVRPHVALNTTNVPRRRNTGRHGSNTPAHDPGKIITRKVGTPQPWICPTRRASTPA